MQTIPVTSTRLRFTKDSIVEWYAFRLMDNQYPSIKGMNMSDMFAYAIKNLKRYEDLPDDLKIAYMEFLKNRWIVFFRMLLAQRIYFNYMPGDIIFVNSSSWTIVPGKSKNPVIALYEFLLSRTDMDNMTGRGFMMTVDNDPNNNIHWQNLTIRTFWKSKGPGMDKADTYYRVMVCNPDVDGHKLADKWRDSRHGNGFVKEIQQSCTPLHEHCNLLDLLGWT